LTACSVGNDAALAYLVQQAYDQARFEAGAQAFVQNAAPSAVMLAVGFGFSSLGVAIEEDEAAGEFVISDWEGYPADVPVPEGSFRIVAGEEYSEARAAANNANRAMHRADPSLTGKQIHEIKPVKFGGSPTDPANKVPLSPTKHAEVTTWWNRLLRTLTDPKK
jgi:hypothetical protein